MKQQFYSIHYVFKRFKTLQWSFSLKYLEVAKRPCVILKLFENSTALVPKYHKNKYNYSYDASVQFS